MRSKEFRKTDPRQIAMKEEEKERSREAYQKVKGRNKAYRDKIKKAKKEKSTKKRLVKREELKKMVMPGQYCRNLHFKKLTKFYPAEMVAPSVPEAKIVWFSSFHA